MRSANVAAGERGTILGSVVVMFSSDNFDEAYVSAALRAASVQLLRVPARQLASGRVSLEPQMVMYDGEPPDGEALMHYDPDADDADEVDL